MRRDTDSFPPLTCPHNIVAINRSSTSLFDAVVAAAAVARSGSGGTVEGQWIVPLPLLLVHHCDVPLHVISFADDYIIELCRIWKDRYRPTRLARQQQRIVVATNITSSPCRKGCG